MLTLDNLFARGGKNVRVMLYSAFSCLAAKENDVFSSCKLDLFGLQIAERVACLTRMVFQIDFSGRSLTLSSAYKVTKVNFVTLSW